MQGYPARIVHDGRGCPVCATTTPTLVVQAGPLPAPYPNPRAEFRDGGPNGTHWYHGTNFDPESSEEPKRLRPEPRDYNDSSAYHKHWNTDFGVHFTSMPDVARDFARNFAGPDRETPAHARIAHADLHMRNPQHFENEHEMVDHAIGVARKHGLHHDVTDDEEYNDIHEGHEDEVGLQKKDEWVNSHPHREQIVNHFEDDLKSKGHDGITYGNSYEGPPGHTCAIAFRSTPVNIHQWEHLHPQHPGHLGKKTAAAQVYYHGTRIPHMTHVLPASQHGKEISYHGETDPKYAYATPNLDDAWEYAMEAHGNNGSPNERQSPGRPRVYEVHPIGGDHHVEDDPDQEPDGTWRGTRSDDKRSPVGFTVKRELEAPDHVKQWYHERDRDNWIDKEGSKSKTARFEHVWDRCPGCFGRGEDDDGRECDVCDGGGRRECPCGRQVAYDPMNGFQHLDGSISHDGKYWDKSVSDLVKMPAQRTAAIRLVPPEEYQKFHYPDYPNAKTPAALAKHFKKTSPDYFEKVKADVQENGFKSPVLVRWNDPRGNPLKKPHVMEGHHRAAVAHELGVHLPVGDYDDDKDYDNSFKAGQDWWRAHQQRPTDDMPKQGVRWMPSKRIFGPTHGLDHRLFDGEKLRPDVRKYILSTLNSFWRPMFGPGWKTWAKVYFAGSEASEWTSQALEGNNDFDILIGVDYDKFRNSVGGMSKESDETITSALNDSLREGLNPRTDAATIFIDNQATGPWDNTWYVNKDSYDIREIRPYAAYDVTADKWVVKPPHLPEWSTSAFPEGKGLGREIRGIIDMAKGILAMPEPYRTQNGRALWEFVHANRSDAFGPQGEGWWDARNVIEKALDQAGLMQKLWALMDHARQDPHALDAPPTWSNDPGK